LVPDPERSLLEGAISVWGTQQLRFMQPILEGLAAQHHIDLRQPFGVLTEVQQHAILYGTAGTPVHVQHTTNGRTHTFRRVYEGVIPLLQRRYQDTESMGVREELERYMRPHVCATCQGTRLRSEALAVLIQGRRISDITAMSVRQAQAFFAALTLNDFEGQVAGKILQEVYARLRFLSSVGLDYLTLNRTAATLSGGEGQ